MKRLLTLCVVLALSCACFAQATHRIPAADTPNTWTNSNTFSDEVWIKGGFLPGCDAAGQAWTWTGSGWSCQLAIGTPGTNGTNGQDGAPGAPGYSPNQIISGCGVVWTSGLTFTVSPCTYMVQNVQYSTALQTVTLSAADATNDRIDIIAADNTGSIAVIDGTPQVNPVPPSVDVSSQLSLTFIYVPAGATIPANVVTTDLYHENAEWTCATSANVNCNSTSNPHAGSKDIEATTATTGNYARLTIPSATIDISTRNNLVFWIRSKATWPTTRSLTLQWFNGTTAKCTPVTLKNGNFTFDTSNTTAYQQIVVPTSVFSCAGVPVTRLQFTVAGSGTTIGYYIDDVILQGGVSPPVASNFLVGRQTWNNSTAYAVNDVVFDKGGSWYAIKANTNSEPSLTNTNWFSMGAVAPFISSSANPAQSGVLRLANNEGIAWRNNTNTADCKLYLDANNNWAFDPCGFTVTEIDFITEACSAATLPASGHSTVCVDTSSGFIGTKDSSGTVHLPGTGSGSVTNIATTSPISGGPITTTGTISCPTCVTSVTGTSPVASSGGTTPAISINNGGITSTQLATANKTRTCHINFGSDDATSDLTTAQIQPQHSQCMFDVAATVLQVTVTAAAGTPNIILSKNHAGTQTALLSSALATGASGAVACSNTGGTTGINGTTTCSATLQNTTVAAGDYVDTTGGATSTGAKWFAVDVTFTVN
jgi:hypothetical protein